MKKMIRTRRILTVIGCFCILAAVGISNVRADGLISREERPGWALPYENFGLYDMRSYDENAKTLASRLSDDDKADYNPLWQGPADPVTYDRLGNFLLPGADAYNLTWDLSDVGASAEQTTQANIFNNLMITTDEFSNWQMKFMIGSSIKTYFTPSTFKRVSFSGIRWDASNRINSVTLIAHVGSKPGDNNGADDDDLPYDYRFRNILGGHWESVLGDIMTVGGTFVMENRGTTFYSNKDIANTRDGLLQEDRERYFYVVVTSDSPEDESISARVYDVQPIIDDEKVDLPTRVFKIPDIITMYKYSSGSYGTDYLFDNEYDDTEYSKVPDVVENYMYSNDSWFLDLMDDVGDDAYDQLFRKYSGSGTLGYLSIVSDSGDATSRYYESVAENGYHEARGTDVVIYEILVPGGARKVEFDVNAGNDYCIDIVACLPSNDEEKVHAGFYDDPKSGWESGSWSPLYETKHCVKASGRVNDDSNTGWVKVAYDRLTGVNVYGLNMEIDWRGLFVRAEINQYNELRAYPIRNTYSDESHSIESSRAWFINFEKDFGSWSAGGEVFDYPNGYMRNWGSEFVDDNDDNNSSTGGDGVTEYPGLNFDHDGFPAAATLWTPTTMYYNDVYFSGEPYIGYYFDEVSYGDDFNHNGIIDERENDYDIDLPYDRDSRGQHYFVTIKPYNYSFVTLGHYDIKQDELGGRNLTSYLKFEHMQRIGDFEYGLFHTTERVKDNYKSDASYDQYYGGPFTIGAASWTGASDSYSSWEGYFNNLAYRDSWVNSTFFKTHLTLFDHMNIVNNVKHDQIDRVGDLTLEGSELQKTYDVPKVIYTTSFIHKIDYEFRISNVKILPEIYWHGIRILKERRITDLSFIPQFKLVNHYLTGNTNLLDGDNHIYNYYPVIRFDYQVAPKTKLRVALQGLPGLMEVYRNRERPLEEENRRRMFIGFETRTLYSGFNILVTTGIRRDKRTYEEQLGRRETGDTEYFITLNVESSG